MSFDISGPSPSRKPVIREAQNMENNGGGGNLGYMRRGKKKEDEEDEFEAELQVLDDESIMSGDSFKKESDNNDSNNETSIFSKLKGFIKKDKKTDD